VRTQAYSGVESFYRWPELNQSIQCCTSPLKEKPEIAEVIQRVQALVEKRRWFDHELRGASRTALALVDDYARTQTIT
jgi:hypothetical protein